MGRRGRQRGRETPRAPTSAYADDRFGELELRGVLTPATRRAYAEATAATGAQTREDAWQRGVEFLFERLAARWTTAGVDYVGQRELLARFRAASAAERAWVRDALRGHLAEHFPDVPAP